MELSILLFLITMHSVLWSAFQYFILYVVCRWRILLPVIDNRYYSNEVLLNIYFTILVTLNINSADNGWFEGKSVKCWELNNTRCFIWNKLLKDKRLLCALGNISIYLLIYNPKYCQNKPRKVLPIRSKI